MKLFLIPLVLLSTSAFAANFVVHTGETTGTQTLTNPGDVGLIEEQGVITVAAGNGVNMLSSTQGVLNKGTVEVTAGGGDGINSIGVGNTIANLGNIIMQSAGGSGIDSAGANTTITNNGLMLITGIGTDAISVSGSNSTVVNNGKIITTNIGGSDGMRTSIGSVNQTLINNGEITILGGAGAIGIALFSDNSFVTNNGLITVGANSLGIRSAADNALITNTGVITANGANSVGVLLISSTPHLINSGTIRSNNIALQIVSLQPTVTLLRRSNIQGIVTVPSGFTLLNVETGLNLALTVQSVFQPFNALGISAPFAILGQTIAVIDPTGLGLQADVVSDLSDTILGGIYRHRFGFPCCRKECERGFWAEGIGSYRDRNHNGSNVGYHNWQGGFLVGYDLPAFCGDVNVFGGATFGKAIVDQRTQTADLSNYFAGASYERIWCQNFIGAGLAMGYSKIDNDRFVMYNLAPGGVQTAHATPKGFFISPEITFAHQFTRCCFSPILSGTVRYAGLFLGSYNERGSIANLSVHHRKVQLVTTRAELGLPFAKSNCGQCWSAEPYLGIAGRFQCSGKDVDATLLGQDISFNVGNPQNLFYGLFGFRGKQSLGCLDLYLNVEADFDNHYSSRIFGEAGFALQF